MKLPRLPRGNVYCAPMLAFFSGVYGVIMAVDTFDWATFVSLYSKSSQLNDASNSSASVGRYSVSNSTPFTFALPTLFGWLQGAIGQAKEEVHKEFEVTKAEPGADAPKGTVHVILKPREGTRLATKFKTIDVWVDPKTNMPVRIEALDVNETTRRTTDLTNIKVNPQPPLNDRDFALPRIDEKKWELNWNVVEAEGVGHVAAEMFKNDKCLDALGIKGKP